MPARRPEYDTFETTRRQRALGIVVLFEDRRVAEGFLLSSLPDPSRSCGLPDPLFICRVGSASDLWTGQK